jgi:hypothetical protein
MIAQNKAAGRAATAADAIRESAYRRPQPLSSGIDAKSDGTGLGLLLLALDGAVLPRAMRRCVWLLVEKWAGEYIAARHAGFPTERTTP